MDFIVNGSSCNWNTLNIEFANGITKYMIEKYDIFCKIALIIYIDMVRGRIIY